MKINQKIDHEKRFFIEISEKLPIEVADRSPCLRLFFSNGKEDRLFPLETSLIKKEDDSVIISGRASILLPYIFFRETEQAKVSVRAELFYDNERKTIGESFFLDAVFFRRQQTEQQGKQEIVMWLLAFLLLPIAVLVSFLHKKRGKAMLKDANQTIKKWTGISFSIRENKTNYFRKQYKKYAKLPVQQNNILFLSERKVEEGGNLSLIYHALQREKGLTLTSFFESKTVDKLDFSSLRESARLIAQAHLIILEDFYPQLHSLDLRAETKVIQLWHACGAFKTFGFSRLHKPGGPEEDSRNHRNYDRVFVSSKQMIPYYSEAFAIPEKNVLPLGTPRTDIFFDETYKRTIRQKWIKEFPDLNGKRVILFAPTFRGLGNKDAFYPERAFSVEELMKELPEDVVLLIKQHPFVKNSISIPALFEDRVWDFSEKASINELLFFTDLLITDYSSSVFEAALLDIPMIFYVFDEEDYKKERDIYGDFDAFIPGVKARNQQELKQAVHNRLNKNNECFYDFQGFKDKYLSALDGYSTERITNEILCMAEEERE